MDSLLSSEVVAVIGAGTMGAGVAQVAAGAGHRVLLYDAQPGAAEKGKQRSLDGLKKLVDRGRLSEEERQALGGRIEPVAALQDLSSAKLVIEAIVEDLSIKQNLFKELESLCAEETIFATNTSSISITAIASALRHPQRFLGMHFFNPAPIMKLVEVVSGLATDSAVAQCIHATANRWGKRAVRAKSTPGFIVNRVARPFYAESLRLLQEQAGDPATLDAVMREAGGFRMGPFELMDLIGHDVNFAVTQSVYQAYFHDPRFTPSLIQQELVLAGRLGRKSGQGFYSYAEDAQQPPVQRVEAGGRPERIKVYGELSVAPSLLDLWRVAGIAIERIEPESRSWQGVIEVEGIQLALTDGRSATRRCAEEGIAQLVLFDLALDYAKAERIAIALSEQACGTAAQTVAGLFQAIGKEVSQIADVPGMLVMRTLAMLANEAADAVNQGVCSIADVDEAMCSGVNYPKGPLDWADDLGAARIRDVLNGLASSYGEDRYRCSPLIHQRVAAGKGFYSDA
jgi:3-hydroxybutyryl-CoA dehydrogenase